MAALVMIVVTTACTSDGRPDVDASGIPLELGTAPAQGGTVIFGAAEQPVTLNAGHPEGDRAVNDLVYSAVLSPLWRVTPDLRYEPLLLDGEPEVGTDPFTVTYSLKPELQWSDGEPLTARDVVFTHDTILEHDLDVPSRRGHALVRSTTLLGDHKVRFEFRRPFAGWRAMFSEPRAAILPRHVLAGRNFEQVWQERVTVSSGPFEVDTWQRGQQLILKRNESYWGTAAHLDEVIITFQADSDARVESLRAGDIDVTTPMPDLDVRDRLAAIEGRTFAVAAGTRWEHIDLNTGAAPLNRAFVRTAIAKAIDRDAIVAQLATPIHDEISALNNVLLLPQQRNYADHWSAVIGYDPAAAEELLVRNGCERPAEVYVCEGVPLELDYVTTADVGARIEQFDLIREDLAQIGVRLTPRLVVSDEAHAGPPREQWHLFSYARQGSPNVLDAASTWRCDAPPRDNPSRYCSRAAAGLLGVASRILDAEQRGRLWNEADAVIARDVPTIPLYVQPEVLAWNAKIEGPAINVSAWGPLWNVGDWRLMQ